jgi:hypothetical protein
MLQFVLLWQTVTQTNPFRKRKITPAQQRLTTPQTTFPKSTAALFIQRQNNAFQRHNSGTPGTGFTAAENGSVIPEFNSGSIGVSISDGAEIYTISKDGNMKLAANLRMVSL